MASQIVSQQNVVPFPQSVTALQISHDKVELGVHEYDGEGRRIEDGPLTTDECCKLGIRLFE